MISLSPSRTLKALLTCAVLAFGSLAHAQQVFRVTTIPDEAATEQVRKFTPLAAYLEKKLGMKVEFTPVSDYPAAVEALVNKKVDLVWFGGFTYVQAQLRSGGKIIPIAQREEDTRFQSVFIAKTDSGIKTLADLKGKQVSFGSQSSTSGHLMPRSFLLQAGIDPEKDFKRIAYSGAHDATIASVVSGKVDAAALDITVWRKFVAENKVDTKEVDVFFTTPPFYDYNWSVQRRHAGRAAQQAAEGAARPGPGHARRQGDPAAEPRHALHPDHARQLQGHRGRGPQRRADLRRSRVKLELRGRGRAPPGCAGRGAGAAAARPAGGRRRAGGGDRPVRRRQDHAAAGAGLRAAAARRHAAARRARPVGAAAARAAAPARPAVPGAAGAAAAAAPARGHRGAGRPAAGDEPAGQPALAVLPAATFRRRTTRWSASTWPTSCSSASTACPAASASASAWRARCWRRPRLWLVDEPLSALDPTRAQQALATLVQQARERGVTLVATLHQVDVALAHFPRIVGLRDGALAFDLPAAEVGRERLARLYAQHEDELYGDAAPLPEEPAPQPSAPVVMHCR